MTRLERTINVSWRHQVIFSDGVFDRFNPALRDVLVNGEAARPARALLVVEEALARSKPGLTAEIEAYFAAHAPAIQLVTQPVVMEGGERVKNAYFHVSEVQAHLDRHHVDRHNYLIAVGGGALLDMVGLAAATAHRGVRHVRVPTTVLAQDDSGVGVKNGINAFGKKNFIGTFAPPFAVLNDFTLLATLPERDKRAGYVEAVKVACIRDALFFAELERDAAALARFEEVPMRRLIRRCAELHLNHIATSGDPFEMGSARPLDFGHWAAHKLEQVSEHRLRHGEAVAIGIALDVLYARDTGLLGAAAADRILRLLEALGFDLYTAELHYEDSAGRLLVLNGLEEFREHLGGELTITLLRDIGVGVEVHEMHRPQVKRAMEELRQRHERRGRLVAVAGAA
ncbi:MAG: 3-dehydroquinate synthase [Limisphaerales bacterium]